MHVEETTTQTLKIVVGNVTFLVDSDDPERVFVSTCANSAIDIENIGELAEAAAKITEFAASLGDAS